MKKKNIIIVILLLFALIASSFVANIVYTKFEYAKKQEHYTLPYQKSELIKIGIIGDSWVGRYNLDKQFENSFLEQGYIVKVIHSSHPGGRTKEIYENLFKNKEVYSSRFIIENQPKYCIILAGVNDAARHMGKDYYVYHMDLIIKTLLNYNIQPIVIELVKFGIEEDFYQKGISSRLGNRISEYLDGNNINNIDAYRTALYQHLKNNNLLDKVVFIDVDRFGINYKNNPELYTDPLHLNEKGYKNLVNGIAKDIIYLMNNEQMK